MIVRAYSYLFPFLLLLWITLRLSRIIRRKADPGRRLIACGVISLILSLVRIEGVSLLRVIYGVNANFSIPLTALLFASIHKIVVGKTFLDERARRAMWGFALVGGALLYPMALGVGGLDPYALGFEFSALFVVCCAFTIWMISVRNNFGVVLLASILAYDVGLLESINLWDYLLDPFLFIWALVCACVFVVRLLKSRVTRRTD